jgi:hypothetical protein
MIVQPVMIQKGYRVIVEEATHFMIEILRFAQNDKRGEMG